MQVVPTSEQLVVSATGSSPDPTVPTTTSSTPVAAPASTTASGPKIHFAATLNAAQVLSGAQASPAVSMAPALQITTPPAPVRLHRTPIPGRGIAGSGNPTKRSSLGLPDEPQDSKPTTGAQIIPPLPRGAPLRRSGTRSEAEVKKIAAGKSAATLTELLSDDEIRNLPLDTLVNAYDRTEAREKALTRQQAAAIAQVAPQGPGFLQRRGQDDCSACCQVNCAPVVNAWDWVKSKLCCQ